MNPLICNIWRRRLQGTRTSSSSVYVRGVTCLGAAKSAASAAKSSALLVVRGWVQCIHSPTHKRACELYMPACALVCQGRSTFPSVLSFLAPSVLRPKTLLFMQKELLPSFIYFYMSRVFVSIREYVRICECMCK